MRWVVLALTCTYRLGCDCGGEPTEPSRCVAENAVDGGQSADAGADAGGTPDGGGNRGVLDPDFNGGLPVVIAYFDDDVPVRQSKDDQATGVVLDSAGRIVVSGSGTYAHYVSGDQDDMATLSLRLFADGGLDPTYQSGATSIPGMTVNASSVYNHGQGIAIDAAGRVVVVGYQEFGGTDDPTLYRYLPDSGQPDSAFGGGGWKNVPSTGEVQGWAIAIDPLDGNYFVAGSRGGADVQLSKVSATTGALVTTFSSDGRLTVDVPGAEQPRAILTDSSGRLYVCGSYDGPAATRDLRVLRFLGDGTLDSAFDGDGVFALDLGSAE